MTFTAVMIAVTAMPAVVDATTEPNLENNQRDQVRDEDPDRDHPLPQHGQRPSPSLGCVLGDVRGGNRGIGSDGQTNQGSRDQQHRNVPAERRQQGAHCVATALG
ncbi:MAG TPA: hypothetical protein VIJ96_05070 [Acidothermaceae bacterium]